MNRWIELSIEYANQRSYLDDLFSVYPTIPDGIRDIDQNAWARFESAYDKQDNRAVMEELLKFDLFPIKDSYVAYLKRDRNSLDRNPRTVNRLCGRLYEMGIDAVYKECTKPKETNRQIGPMFKGWLGRKALGITPVGLDEFQSTSCDSVLDASDAQMQGFAREYLGYKHTKGLDLVARFNGKYVIGEAKFLTDFGGHQNAQFNDAIATLTADVEAVTVAVLDGVLYIPGNHKMYRSITEEYADQNIMSALVLREFLYSM